LKQSEANAILAILDRNGWWNGRVDGPDPIRGDGHICLKMAIDRAITERGRKDIVLDDIGEQVKLLFPERVYHREFILPRSFNDHSETTEADVRAVVKAAVTVLTR